MAYQAVVRSAMRTHGILSRPIARGLGIHDRSFDRLIQTRKLVRLHRGVYRLSGFGPTWQGDALAACLRFDGVASHITAARLHGIGEFTSTTPDVTVGHGDWRRSSGARIHVSKQLHLTSPIVRDGVPCTPIDRTVLDLGAVVGVDRLTDIVDEVIRSQVLTWRQLYLVLAIHSIRGRNGCGTLRAVLDRQDPTRRVPESKWSRMVERLLMAHGLPRPELEYVIRHSNGGEVGRFDLVYPDARLVIELDSRTWHDNDDKFESDRERVRELQLLGWTIFPLTWKQFIGNGAGFAAQVAHVVSSEPILEASSPRISEQSRLQNAKGW